MAKDPAVDRLIDYRRRLVAPVAAAHHLELAPETAFTAPPMILLLGNHSSGKSSMINHLLGRGIQRTGVAPTDDGFTLLYHATDEQHLDGKAVVTSPGLPFSDLNRFGPGLVEHCQGRGLPVELLRHVRLIDSPGMIDGGAAEAQRPYDFPAVVRWFAEQADLILLFFDPEKPGTTGETLTTLTEALAGVDNKLRIVMNKMDLFEGLRDFARTYGALCWNLSRNLPTKDLPHIYTTVIPELARSNPRLPLDGFAAALLELETFIAELPAMRTDAVLSRAIDEARLLHLRATVVEAVRSHAAKRRNLTLLGASLLGLGMAVASLVVYEQQGAWYSTVGLAIGALLVVALGAWIASLVAGFTKQRARGRLEEYFQVTHRARFASGSHAEDLHHDWAQVRPAIQRSFDAVGVDGIKRVKPRQLRNLRSVWETDLPALRRAR